MKRYMQFFVLIMMILFFGIEAMEKQRQPLTKRDSNMIKNDSILRKVIVRSLSGLSIADHENILHIGPCCQEIMRSKNPTIQLYCIDTSTLAMLQEPAQKYDKILSFVCWDVIKKPQETLKDVVRVLKKGGQFCAVFPYYKSPYLETHYSVIMSEKWEGQFNKERMVAMYGSKKNKQLLVEAGLGDNVSCSVVKKPFIFKNKDTFKAWIASFPEQLDGIAEKDHTDFINDIVEKYVEKYPLKNDSVIVHLPYMVLSGYKS